MPPTVVQRNFQVGDICIKVQNKRTYRDPQIVTSVVSGKPYLAETYSGAGFDAVSGRSSDVHVIRYKGEKKNEVMRRVAELLKIISESPNDPVYSCSTLFKTCHLKASDDASAHDLLQDIRIFQADMKSKDNIGKYKCASVILLVYQLALYENELFGTIASTMNMRPSNCSAKDLTRITRGLAGQKSWEVLRPYPLPKGKKNNVF